MGALLAVLALFALGIIQWQRPLAPETPTTKSVELLEQPARTRNASVEVLPAEWMWGHLTLMPP